MNSPRLPKDPDRSPSRPGLGPGPGLLSTEASQNALHDLRVHQIELELQNEELRKTQLLLEASRERYVSLYDFAPVAYFTLAPNGLIEEANLTAAGLLGVPRSALLKRPLTRFIFPADQDTYYHHRKQLLETGARQVSELRLVRMGEPQPCWVRLEAALVSDASGLSRAVVSDITTQKRAEETLRASEARHRTLFEKSPDALMTMAPPDWRFTSGNATTLALFGVANEAEFVSRFAHEYWPDRQPDGSLSTEKSALMIEQALREGSHGFEWIYKRLSGQEFPANVVLTRIEIENQSLLQATVRDETETKRLHTLLSQADRLSSMGMLAAGVAHEINNPLVSVLFNVESLATDIPKLGEVVGRCRDALQIELGIETVGKLLAPDAGMLEPEALTDLAKRASDALDATRRIRAIAKAFGTFSRVEDVTRSRLDLNYAVECAVTMAQSNIKYKAEVVLDLGQLPKVWASEGKLSQVFLNLLINAGQAIDEGGLKANRISVRTWADGDDVVVEVEDTGKGISEANLARIFDPFFTTKPIGMGSGLGLSICKNILNDFGGSIEVESELGRGTRFTVRVPVLGSASSAPAAPLEIPGIGKMRGRILLVDDEQAIRTATVRLLASEHEVVAASSGEEARDVLEHDPSFDVILCDLMMPRMTGTELHQWIFDRNPALAKRVVFVTGGVLTLKASEYVARAGNLRLEKPTEPAKLKRLMAELVAAAKRQS